MTEDDKELVEVMKDAVLHGTGFMKNGKHVPIDDVYLDPRDARIEALSAENERLREQLSGISGRLEAMRVALIHTAGICNPLSGFLKNVTGLRKKHLDSVQAIARAALGEQQ